MDSAGFLQWVSNRLVPAFKAKYGTKKMVLVLDNARHHHGAEEGGLQLLHYNKALGPNAKHGLTHGGGADQRNLVDLCIECGCPEMRVFRDNELCVFKQDALHKRPSKAKLVKGQQAKGGPSHEELRTGLREWTLGNKPWLLETELQHRFEAMDHRLLFTPPYSPKMQPTELLWRDSKNCTASQWSSKRNPAQAAGDMMDFFHGTEACRKHGKPRLRYGPEQAQQHINKAMSECNAWIDKNGTRLSGVLGRDLKCDSSAAHKEDGSIVACPYGVDMESGVSDEDDEACDGSADANEE